MPFDIHQHIFDEDGTLLEQEAKEYQDQLLELFEQSPEAEALSNEGIEGGWIGMMMDFGMNYIGVTPAEMSASHLREILFDLIPRKVSAQAEEAPDIIREFQAFWSFLQREFHLANATACLNILNEKAAQELKRRMSNPANFGMAKSFFMMGTQRGFDMESEEGINQWMRTYNAELAAGTGTPINIPGQPRMSRQELASRIHILGAPTEHPWPSDDKQKPKIVDAAPTTTRTHPYTPPVDNLLTYTDIEGEDPLPEISYAEKFGIAPEHIPELIRMATDDYLASADANEFEATAPLHAVSALAELHAEAAIDPLLTYFDKASQNDHEWMLETLVDFYLTVGPVALPSLEQFLADPSHDDSAQNYVGEIIGKMPQKHPEARTECIAVVMRRLADFEVNDPELNGCLIGGLIRMKALEAVPLIEEAFANDCVDESWCGDWTEVQYSLGLKERPATKERFSLFSPPSTPTRPTTSIPTTPTYKPTKKTPASKKAKTKSKMAKASKRANRRKK
jgi:hypothetical protein